MSRFERKHADDGVVIQSRLNPDGQSRLAVPQRLHDEVKTFLLNSANLVVVKRTIPHSQGLIESFETQAKTYQCLLAIEPSATSTVFINSASIHVSTGNITEQQVTMSKRCAGQNRSDLVRRDCYLFNIDASLERRATSGGKRRHAAIDWQRLQTITGRNIPQSVETSETIGFPPLDTSGGTRGECRHECTAKVGRCIHRRSYSLRSPWQVHQHR